MFKEWINLGLAFVLFALVWVAGHDILKGQPNPWMEWTAVVAGGMLALRVAWKQWPALLRLFSKNSR